MNSSSLSFGSLQAAAFRALARMGAIVRAKNEAVNHAEA
jgi:hypothetical protein